jgi:WD40 repeat protein
VAEHKVIAHLDTHAAVRDAAFSRDGKLVVTAGSDGAARVFDVAAGKRLAILRAGTHHLVTAGFGSSSNEVVTVDDADVARHWDVAREKATVTARGPVDEPHSASLGSDGKLVLEGGLSGARVWDSASGETVRPLRFHRGSGDVYSVAFSRDGKLAVTGGDEPTARVWALDSGLTVAELTGSVDLVASVAFSPDSKLVATAGNDHVVRVFGVATGRAVAELDAPEAAGDILSVSFSPDGRSIVTTASDGRARIYACDVCGSTKELLALAKARTTRGLTQQERQTYLHER